MKKANDGGKGTTLEDKIRYVLIEARVVLPGTQALLGFQLVGVLQSGFETLPKASKAIHLGGLGFLAASMLLLMLPAAYHRIAERGEISERLHKVSSRSILAGMIALACGLACDVYVVVQRVTSSEAGAAAAASVWLVTALTAWVALMLLLRGRKPEAPPVQSSEEDSPKTTSEMLAIVER